MARSALRKLSFFCLLTLAASAGRAEALQIVNGYTFNGSFVAPDSMDVNPFDPTLGTLDSVTVSLQGQMTVTGITSPLHSAYGPIPYSYSLIVEQNFLGLGSNLFDFGSPAQYFFSGNASGGGEGFALVRSFGFSFSFTEISDLRGFAIPSFSGADVPPVTINAMRSDFIEGGIPLYEIDLSHSFLSVSSGAALPYGLNAQSAGSMLITYEYTPMENEPGSTPVPEPASLLLFGTGLAGWAAGTRRRRS